MRKLLTAIGNSILNTKLSENQEWNVLEDIKTDIELIDFLERENDIEILFLSSKIIKNYDIDEYIEKIKKINSELFIIFFNDKESKNNVKENLNLMVYNQNEIDSKYIKKILEKKSNKPNNKINSKIIAITGANGVGKSTFSTFFAKYVEKKEKKTLLIDFDLEENQIRTLLKVKKQLSYTGSISEVVVNVNKNLDVLCCLNDVFNSKSEIEFFKIQKIINNFKEKYDLIIIDTSSNLENEYTKRIFYNCDDVIVLMEPNILGIKKTRNLIEVFENDWKIKYSKMKIMLYKTDIYQISKSIIKEVFPDIKIIGNMKYKDSYNLMINKNVDKKEIEEEYEKIYKKLYE